MCAEARWPTPNTARPAAESGHVLRGRDGERSRLAELIDTARTRGRGAVVSVIGPPGSGKTALLADAEARASALGFRVARIRMDEELRPVLSHLDRVPLLVTLDDLRWSDLETSRSICVLCTKVASAPVVCVIARRPDEHEPSRDRLYRYLDDCTSLVQVELGPLSDEAVAAVVADVLGAEPDGTLKSLVACAEGNPATLIELVNGIVRDGVVRCGDGFARLAGLPVGDATLPRSFADKVYRKIGELSAQARQVLDIAAVLGRSFVPDDVAEMLGQPVAALVPVLKEALSANVLECTADGMRFRRDVVWQVILQCMPVSVRGALHRQAAAMLVDRGGSPVDSAGHLVHGALRGDAGAVDALRRAAEETLHLSPRTAAELALRGLELVTAESEARVPLTTIAVEACTRSGPLSRAIELASQALADPLPGTPIASTRYWLSTALMMEGRPAEALEVARQALADAGTSAELRCGFLLNQMLILGEHTAQDDLDGEEPGRLLVSAMKSWRAGYLSEALIACREAVALCDSRSAVTWVNHPRVAVAAILCGLREFDDAEAAINDVEKDVDHVLSGVLRIMRSMVDLGRGRSANAVVEATAGLAAARGGGTRLHLPNALAVLTTVALRRGDLVVDQPSDSLLAWARSEAAGMPSICLRWTDAQMAAARGDDTPSHRLLDSLGEDEETLRTLLVEEPSGAVWVVRTALAAGRRDLAEHAVVTADRLGADNADAPSVVAAAAHARGVLHSDAPALADAVVRHQDVWARASAHEDLGVLLRDVDREVAVEHLDEAVSIYQSIQAERDAARGRRRLRSAGVLRRPSSRRTGVISGVNSLTETERVVATLVVTGLTNQQVAKRMFISRHTVAFHLRNAFRKLGITSRVELARYVRPGSA